MKIFTQKTIKFLSILVFLANVSFAANDFPIVDFPTWVISPFESFWIKWADLNGSLTNNKIYFSRNPGGANLENYPDSITNVLMGNTVLDENDKGKTGIKIRMLDNQNFKPGVNYVVLGDKEKGISSNEIKLILKHNEQNTNFSPNGGFVDNPTPQFSWTKPAGVPYSHVILSDEEARFDTDEGISLASVKGISMIWQAITPNNMINYGEPDPSGIFTAAPPPLTPGKKYTWMVFNNYGNNPTYTSMTDLVFPAFFEIKGTEKPQPENAYPLSKDNVEIKNPNDITFKWTNLDPDASVYHIFVYTSARMTGLDAQIAVWDGSVTAGQFKKPDGTMMDTASLTVNAKDIFSENYYTWRVIAEYSDGSGQASELEGFKYSAPAGKIIVRTQEEINAKTSSGKDTAFTQWLAAAEIKIEVIDGSLEETMLFFTDNNGYAERFRPAGTIKVTAQKANYESESQIVSISEGNTTTAWITLRKPIPSVYGRITDMQGNPVDLANITAISDNGDTVITQSLPDGNFVMNCKPESWTLVVRKQGFINSPSIRIVLAKGNVSQQNISIKKNPLVFSGTVKTATKTKDGLHDSIITIAGATVKVLSADGNNEIASLLSTPSSGRFSFSLSPGTYIISATKTGLASKDTAIQFSSSQDKDIFLQNNAALLKGTINGISRISKNGTLNPLSAAVVNAKAEVIDASTNKIIATAKTDKVYGTYNISVPAKNPAEKYMLRFTAEGFETDSALTNTIIESGQTYTQDFNINALATIDGKVFEINDGNRSPVSGVSVSLINNEQIYTSITNSVGEFTFFRIPKGEYLITANGSELAKDTVELIVNETNTVIKKDNIKIKDGMFFSGDTAVISAINILTKPVNATITWTTITNGDILVNNPSISVVVYSPFVQKIENGRLSGLDPSISYFVRAASSNNPNIIDCVEKETKFENPKSENLEDEILMPFRHIPTNDNTIKLLKWKSINMDDYSISINYRQHGETNFDSVITVFETMSDTIISFEIPHKIGNNIDYYFNINAKSGSIKYGNKTHPYTKFVAGDPKIVTRWELLPAAQNITLAINGRAGIYVKAYYGANFEEIENIKPADFSWYLKTKNASIPNKIEIEDDALIITGNKAGEDTLVVKPISLQKANGVSDSITLPIKITDSEIGSVKTILLSDLSHPEFMTNNEKAIFGVIAKDKKGNLVSVTPQWIVTPKTAGKINPENGIFTPSASFIGRVFITAQVNSRVRDEFVLHEKNGLLVAYTVNDFGGSGGDQTAELTFAPKAAQTPIIVSLDKIETKNFVERDLEETGTLIISDIFEVKRQIGENFAVSVTSQSNNTENKRNMHDESDIPVSLKLFIPQIYHKNFNGGQNDKNRLDIAIWDKDSLRWEYKTHKDYADNPPNFEIKDFVYNEEEKSLSLSIGEHLNNFRDIRAAIVAKGLKMEAEISISPNPFSPFVSPMNDYHNITGMNGDVKGTCIKITPKSNTSKFKPAAQVSIFTANGSPVYYAKLNGLDAGQSYFLFWDGRVQLSQTEINKIDIAPNKALFVKGNELCRNGRYFVNVTIDDGKEKKRYTKEIILFK